ncbi:MAG: Maf family protein [Acholeplasmataceae bacterium]
MLILGSSSKRREELLLSAGLTFKVVDPIFDESNNNRHNVKPESYALNAAKRKNYSLKEQYPNDVLITADTIVVFGKEILGKPKDLDDAYHMLEKLRGKKHEVITAVCITQNKKEISFTEKSTVYFNNVSDDEIKTYVETKEPLGKAGSYAIQGKGSFLIEKYEGDFHTIMGLPLKKVIENLEDFSF